MIRRIDETIHPKEISMAKAKITKPEAAGIHPNCPTEPAIRFCLRLSGVSAFETELAG